jgi:hypothetical protein
MAAEICGCTVPVLITDADSGRLAVHSNGDRSTAVVHLLGGDDMRHCGHTDPCSAHLRIRRSGRNQAAHHGKQQRFRRLVTANIRRPSRRIDDQSFTRRRRNYDLCLIAVVAAL